MCIADQLKNQDAWFYQIRADKGFVVGLFDGDYPDQPFKYSALDFLAALEEAGIIDGYMEEGSEGTVEEFLDLCDEQQLQKPLRLCAIAHKERTAE